MVLSVVVGVQSSLVSMKLSFYGERLEGGLGEENEEDPLMFDG